jgi:pimeloyl-ACP methyl ester carboxylesterase
MPVLLLQGEHDMPLALAIADSITRRLPNARRVVIPDAGHGAHFDQPDRFLGALRAFLSSTGIRR